MAKYSEAVIEQIKTKLSIVEVVGNYLILNKKGDRYWGLCPFHTEKTPSFSVLPDRGFFHCFGCGKSGSMFDFVMEMEHISFPESVRMLAESCGVALQEETEIEKKRKNEVDTLKDLYGKLAASFHYILKETLQGAKARAYLDRRKISFEIREKFLLGYAPEDPEWLYRFLVSKHYSEKLLLQSGLFSKRNHRYPLFTDRLMFPIRDWKGQCVAFGGRDLSDRSKAKYINTPETSFYKKREIVYGLYESISSLKKNESAYLCEGYFDVMALHQSGLDTAMAPLGTAFTADQGRMIRRYANKAYLLFDSDRAGQAATHKALIICEQLSLEGRVIVLSEAKDPAELMEREGESAVRDACSSSWTAFDHLVNSAVNLYDVKKPKGKLQVLNEVKPYLDAVDSEIVRQEYLRHLSDRLGIALETLLQDYKVSGTKTPVTTDVPKENYSWSRSIDLYAVMTLMNNRHLYSAYRNKLRISDLSDEAAIELYTVLENALRADMSASDEIVLSMIQDPYVRQLVAMSFQSGEFISNPEQLLDDSAKRMAIRRLENKRKNIEKLLRVAEMEETGSQDVTELLQEKKSLDEQLARMRKLEHV
ncbi:MAG: DNA primase [Sphaerochaetaceae bacterium]|jgi:DNA primase|nr:DNA primase [Sphaerochaetaceae bacterium]NLO61325.1 DNA primase [Spirochaetales bacterium]MDD2406722.1 DNA primase [Sphaerochaetaceae bacterium]MDD4259672.1 DNA primase [Sphaerochaetaceae bacterium]MDD4762318.1 DNA primase [Sphaerochaetaceae bacterium]